MSKLNIGWSKDSAGSEMIAARAPHGLQWNPLCLNMKIAGRLSKHVFGYQVLNKSPMFDGVDVYCGLRERKNYGACADSHFR